MRSEIKRTQGVLLMAGFSALMLATAVPALAGFQWTAPAGTSFGAPTAPSSVNWGEAPSMPAQKVQGIQAMPLPGTWGAIIKGRVSSGTATDVVSGFGSDLPLNVALQQVVPQQYKVSLAPGVDADTSVSWQGDRPWQQVLSDMLARPGLVFAIQGNALIVKPSSHGAHVAAPRGKTARVSKMDMIPDDMVSYNDMPSVPPASLTSSGPIPMVVWHDKAPSFPPPPIQEMEVAPVSAPQMASAPAALSPSAVQHAVQPGPLWHAGRGQTLKDTLTAWAKQAHVQVYWATDYDYRLSGDAAFSGTFEEAAGRLLDQFSAARPQPYGELHGGPDGRVLVVNTYGTTN